MQHVPMPGWLVVLVPLLCFHAGLLCWPGWNRLTSWWWWRLDAGLLVDAVDDLPGLSEEVLLDASRLDVLELCLGVASGLAVGVSVDLVLDGSVDGVDGLVDFPGAVQSLGLDDQADAVVGILGLRVELAVQGDADSQASAVGHQGVSVQLLGEQGAADLVERFGGLVVEHSPYRLADVESLLQLDKRSVKVPLVPGKVLAHVIVLLGGLELLDSVRHGD
mmetsp:Transcript_2006/g.5561  ORF Transcript_2006/g.5561 Transcript_2006/m.5561 type:complete len:220 (+) Transcript_2006:200-859(+)